MKKEVLIEKLTELGVKENEYSLDGSLIYDNIIVYNNYKYWEVFYLDERGGRNVEKRFSKEEDAYDYVYQLFLDLYNLREKYY